MALYKFQQGGVEYPLLSSTSNTLLQDADPALYYAIDLFSSAIESYAGPRLLAQAALENLNFPSAVEKALHVAPTPYLLSDQFVFPLFCLYRTDDDWSQHTVAHDKSTSTWEWNYVLPPLTPRQIEALHPILRTVSAVVSTFAMQSFDTRYNATKTLRDLSGIMDMRAGPVKYGDFELADENGRWWRALSGKLYVRERTELVIASNLDKFEGADVNLDLDPIGDEKIVDFVADQGGAPISIETISPSTGTKAGSTLVAITGQNFRPGRLPPKVLIGGAYATDVVVTHATRLQCLTPSHDATPTFAADVQVISAEDGYESNVLEGAFTFTTP